MMEQILLWNARATGRLIDNIHILRCVDVKGIRR